MSAKVSPTYPFVRWRVKNEERDNVAIPHGEDSGEHGARPLEMHAASHQIILPRHRILAHLSKDVSNDCGRRAD